MAGICMVSGGSSGVISSLPVTVKEGGTSAITAADARTNLGALGKPVVLWNGNWGGSGSARITIPGLNTYTWIAFYPLPGTGTAPIVVPLPVNNLDFTLTFTELQANGSVVFYNMRAVRDIDALSLNSAIYLYVTPSGAITTVVNPTNMIVSIQGVV